MSYEIFYNLFTIQKDKFIPMIVNGSNNCYEATSRRRERNLNRLWLFGDKLENIKDVEIENLNELDNMC